MAEDASARGPRLVFWLATAVMLGLTVRGLASHAEFQPVATVRAVAPVLALMAGGAFTHAVARRRRGIDVEGGFDPGGRALFMGVVMLVFTLLAWLTFAQGLPSFVTSAMGERRSEAAIVAGRPPVVAGSSCPWRLELSGPGWPRAVERCVSQALWNEAVPGRPLTVDTMAGPFGSEIVDVHG